MKQSDCGGKQIGKGFDAESITCKGSKWCEERRYNDAQDYNILLHDTVI